MKKIRIDGLEICYRDNLRNAPAVVFIHGNSHSSGTFFNQFDDELLNEFRLVAIDLPGHGNSQWDKSTDVYSIPYYADILNQFSRKLGLNNSIFIGHSLGGHILLHATDELNPNGVLIYGTPPLGKPIKFEKAFLANQAAKYLMKGDLSETEAFIFASSLFHLQEESQIIRTTKNILATDPLARVKLGESLVGMNFKNEIEIVENFKCPLAILIGEMDGLVNYNYFQELKIPSLWQGQIHFVPNAGHNIHIDAPQAFNLIVSRFAHSNSHHQKQGNITSHDFLESITH